MLMNVIPASVFVESARTGRGMIPAQIIRIGTQRKWCLDSSNLLRHCRHTVRHSRIARGFVSLFDFPTFGGWVTYLMICFIPMQIVTAVTWGTNQPRFAAKQRQPLKGLLLTAALSLRERSLRLHIWL